MGGVAKLAKHKSSKIRENRNIIIYSKNKVINHVRPTRASDAKKELHGAGSDLNKNTTTGRNKRTGGLDRPSAELMTNSTACTYVVAADSTDAASGVSTKTLESNPAEERRCQQRRFIYFQEEKCFSWWPSAARIDVGIINLHPQRGHFEPKE